MDASSPEEYAALCDEIQAVLDRPAAPEHSLERLEDWLTEGYARALALEAERWRLERRIGELGADVRVGDGVPGEEIATLAARLSQASDGLAKLRALLAALRERVDAVRTARVASARSA